MNNNTKDSKVNLIFVESCQSTNTFLKEKAFTLDNLTSVFTGNQLSGRGRKGNAWECRDGEGVAVSVLLRNVKTDDLLKLPLYSAVAAASLCQRLTEEECLIKWPNDIICKNKKLCGILCESCFSEEECSAVLGFGINLLQSEEEFFKKELPYAGSVKSVSGKDYKAKDVAKMLLDEIKDVLKKSFEDIMTVYGKLCLTIGREITVINGNERYAAFAKGLNEKGELIVIRDGKEVTVNSGIASIRGLDGGSARSTIRTQNYI